jgi:hypothetical protein
MSTNFNEIIPIINLPNLYANGADCSVLSNTAFNISAGQVRDSTNIYDIISPTTLTANAANVGANGLDQGTLAASTMYYIYLIYDPTNQVPVASLISASATQPLMPSVRGVTYGAFRIVDCWPTNSSSDFVNAYSKSGNSTIVQKQYDDPPIVLNAATGGPTAFSLTPWVPPMSYGQISLLIKFTPVSPNDHFTIWQFSGGSGTNTVIEGNGLVAGVQQITQGIIIPQIDTGNPALGYQVFTAGTLSVFVDGFDYYL